MFITTVKMLLEVALLALLGRGALALLAGAQRESNLAYRVLHAVSQPVVCATRWVMPKVVLDRHVPLAAFGVLLLLWLLTTLVKIRWCLAIGVALCR